MDGSRVEERGGEGGYPVRLGTWAGTGAGRAGEGDGSRKHEVNWTECWASELNGNRCHWLVQLSSCPVVQLSCGRRLLLLLLLLPLPLGDVLLQSHMCSCSSSYSTIRYLLASVHQQRILRAYAHAKQPCPCPCPCPCPLPSANISVSAFLRGGRSLASPLSLIADAQKRHTINTESTVEDRSIGPSLSMRESGNQAIRLATSSWGS